MDNRTPEEREYNFDSIKGLYLRREIEPEGGTLPKVLSQVESFRQKAPIGTIAPNFTGMLLDGGEFNLEQMSSFMVETDQILIVNGLDLLKFHSILLAYFIRLFL